MNLVLLAAGKGSRLPREFRTQPKCLASVKGQSIFQHNLNFFRKFKNKIIITGYKSKILEKIAKENNFKVVKNKFYRSTNMVFSLFLARKLITDDVVVCYGDILFDNSLYELLKKKKNIMPVNKNWLKLWKKRMRKSEILLDAESLVIKNKKLISLGDKIKKKLPQFQYMGIYKIKKKTYFNMFKYFQKIKKNKIDMTGFLNSCLQNKILKFNASVYNKYWFEVDNGKDLEITNKYFKKW